MTMFRCQAGVARRFRGTAEYERWRELDALVKALNTEILWHQKNRGGSGCGASFENGFICGLKQARRLARKAM